MAFDEKKKPGKGGSGAALPSPTEYSELYKNIQAGERKLSLQDIVENAAVTHALADILVEDGIIKEKDGISPMNRIEHSQDLYGGVLAGLIMLLSDDELVPDIEEKLEDGIIAAHRTMMHFGTRLVPMETIINYRQEMYKAIRAKRRKAIGD